MIVLNLFGHTFGIDVSVKLLDPLWGIMRGHKFAEHRPNKTADVLRLVKGHPANKTAFSFMILNR